MIKDSNQYLPIFKKIVLHRNARLQPDSLKTVVSCVRSLQKQVDPINCSYNPNAIIKDSDLALEQIKRKEYTFNQLMQKEMNKLNFSNSPNIKAKSTHFTQDSKQRKAFQLSMKSDYTQDLRFHSCSPGFNTKKSTLIPNVYERLSTPLPTQTNARYSKSEIRKYKVNQVEKLLDDCTKFHQDMKKNKGKYENISAEGLEEDLKINEFFNGKKSKKESEGVLGEDGFGFDMKVAKACVRGRKIWKMNHISFIATVDRMMNSVPLMKK